MQLENYLSANALRIGINPILCAHCLSLPFILNMAFEQAQPNGEERERERARERERERERDISPHHYKIKIDISSCSHLLCLA